ncbi:MAG: hypothetical protein ABSH08_17395, partial [Tepidisphaeraceae bacterium]
MKRAALAPLVVFLLCCSAWGQEVPLNNSIESVELFKNGLAIVHQSADIAGPGVYRLDNVPAPVHGTFWITGDVAMDAQVTMRDVDVPANNSPDFQENLIGKSVKIQLKEGTLPPVVGRVMKVDRPKGNQAWNRGYEQPQYSYQDNSQPQSGGFLVIETDHGRTYVDSAAIAFMDVTDAGPSIHQRQPVLLLTPRDGNKGTVHISYLTKGLAWAPSYRVELIDDHNLSVEQQAVVKNEMQDFKDAEVTLISGYPNIRFSNVLSPLSLEQTWARFFEQINANPTEVRGAMANNAVVQQAMPNADDLTSGLDMSAIPAGEGADLHFQPIGKHSLGEGDSLMVSVAQNTAPYDRIVEWIVADNRDVDGRAVEASRNGDSAEPRRDQPWDAIRFKNPLPFAMTTGPA